MIGLMITAAAQASLNASVHDLSLDVPPDIATTAPSGTEIIRLIVSPAGRIVGCSARVAGGGTVIDRVNCGKLGRYTAIPAIDDSGQRLFGVSELKLMWSLIRPGQRSSEETPPTVADFYLPLSHRPAGASGLTVSRLTLVTAADGTVETCAVERTSGYPALDDVACRAVKGAGMTPLRDDAGNAVRAVQTVTVGFTVQS